MKDQIITKDHSDYCIGIDFGTTNSVCATAFAVDGKIETPVINIERCTELGGAMRGMETRASRAVLPSFVYYPNNTEEPPMVGDVGKAQRTVQPYAVVGSVKSQMGEKYLKESYNVPNTPIIDKTPEEAAARILAAIRSGAEKYTDEPKITDAVAALPAGYMFNKRQATARAYEIAGFEVGKDSSGMYNDDEMFISEPEAVIYDAINQDMNGTINMRIDFSSPKNILVYDIGGGTLDITIHTIEKKGSGQYNIAPIATNRYSNIAGDKFDNAIVNKVYERYYRSYNSKSKEVGEAIKKDEDRIKRAIIPYAENTKVDIGNRYHFMKNSGKKLSKDKEFHCGGAMPNGYALDEYITVGEFEEYLEPLMGRQYTYGDYKNFDSIRDSANIIYPLLDVLNKASEKLGEDVKIDGVIMNGGMSRLYLIPERLEEFFGFKPIQVTDPDLSVAKGAAVYHYYLHQKRSIMNRIGFDNSEEEEAVSKQAEKEIGILSSGDVLPESIYLGLGGGIEKKLASASQQLPYRAEKMTGFKITAGQSEVSIPIRRKTASGYETIASGRIKFGRKYTKDTNVTVSFSINRNQLLSFEAWTSRDNEGNDVIERGSVELNLGENISRDKCVKLAAPDGTIVSAKMVMSQLKNLCNGGLRNAYRIRNSNTRQKQIKTEMKKIRQQKNIIMSCGNPEDFADIIISDIQTSNDENYVHTLLPIARKLAVYWSEEDKTKLAAAAERILKSDIARSKMGLSKGSESQVTEEAIKLLGAIGDKKQASVLANYESASNHRSALLFGYSRMGEGSEWIQKEFLYDMDAPGRKVQDSVMALGALIRNGGSFRNGTKDLIEALLDRIEEGNADSNTLVLLVTSLGYCCSVTTDAELIVDAENVMSNLRAYYSFTDINYSRRAIDIARNLIRGKELGEEDEKYLLKLYEG